jgi:hypothetical protein
VTNSRPRLGESVRGFRAKQAGMLRTRQNLSPNCGLLSIGYNCRMIRLTDEQWERIQDHFQEEDNVLGASRLRIA